MMKERTMLSVVTISKADQARASARRGSAMLGRARLGTDLARGVAVFALAISLSGCSAAILGNAIVFAVTLGIFFGTLGLGRTSASAATRSTDDTFQR